MKSFFIDAGYLIASESSDDQNHNVALRHWQDMIKSLPPLVTTLMSLTKLLPFSIIGGGMRKLRS